MTLTDPAVAGIVASFRTGGELLSLERCPSGHIHDTYIGSYRTRDGGARFLHQRINRSVFRSPERLMENIERISEHLRAKLGQGGDDPSRRTLSIVPTDDGANFLKTETGEFWRTFRYIEGARTYDRARGPEQVREVARAFARFQVMMADLSGPRLHETIPGFGNLPLRFDTFRRAIDDNRADRASGVVREIEFALARESDVRSFHALFTGRLVQERIIHFDTKMNNVLIDDITGEGICVIDLDTVMPGTVLYDFGDCARSGTAKAAEEEHEPGKAGFDLRLFESLAAGYLEAAGSFLTDTEIEHLAEAARVITLVAGVRFLTDYLDGDIYFRTTRQRDNLYRCRTQFAMVRQMEVQAAQMESIIGRIRLDRR